MATPEPEPVDDSYPESWKPRERIELDKANRPRQLERELLEMDPVERVTMLRRLGIVR